MKAILCLFIAFVLFSTVALGQEILTGSDVPGYLVNALRKMGIYHANATIEKYTYGPYQISASGAEYLPNGEYERWYDDVYRNGRPDQILFFQGSHDRSPFPNAKMNSALNHLLGEDRGVPVPILNLVNWMVEVGVVRMFDMLPPIESGSRIGIMYRVIPKAPPAVATVPMVDSLKNTISGLREEVAALKAAQPAPAETRIPLDGTHLFVGGYIAGSFAPSLSRPDGDVQLSARGLMLMLSIRGRTQFGIAVGGAYEGQGGISLFADRTFFDLYDEPWRTPLAFVGGASISIFRKLNETESPRTARYGQIYVGIHVYLFFAKEHPIDFTFGPAADFEILTTKEGGVQFTDWHFGSCFARVSVCL